MKDSIQVNLHCHSSRSDGTLSPEDLADHLAGQGVRCASLTDHDTVDGLPAFRQALARWGVGCIDGVEVSVRTGRGELHLLGYGIDPEHPALRELLAVAKAPGLLARTPPARAPAARGPGARRRRPEPPGRSGPCTRPGGPPSSPTPSPTGLEPAALEALLAELAAAGLDGLEAVYAPYSAGETARLAELAERHGLLASAGTDFHEPGLPGQPAGVAMGAAQWRAFRGRLLRGRRPRAAAARADGPGRAAPPPAGPRPRDGARPRPPAGPRRRPAGRFAARIVVPTAAAVALFTLSIFALIIPGFERALLERKKETIRELTNSAASILAEYEADERAGRLTGAEAQEAAAARIRDLRYGREGKDYFWITDLGPRMIVHPYRPELVGTDVGGYTDANGVRVFVEFVNAARRRDEGYVEYLWQWKDDSHRIVPKLSFIRRFAPWDWVIGTGIYLDDVRAEIAALAGRLVWLSAGITLLVALLLLYVAQQSLAVERGRRRAESALRDSHERYRALVEAATEGMLVVVDGACVYANRTFLSLLGLRETELPLLRLEELVRARPGEEEAVQTFLAALEGERAAPAAPPPPRPASACWPGRTGSRWKSCSPPRACASGRGRAPS